MQTAIVQFLSDCGSDYILQAHRGGDSIVLCAWVRVHLGRRLDRPTEKGQYKYRVSFYSEDPPQRLFGLCRLGRVALPVYTCRFAVRFARPTWPWPGRHGNRAPAPAHVRTPVRFSHVRGERYNSGGRDLTPTSHSDDVMFGLTRGAGSLPGGRFCDPPSHEKRACTCHVNMIYTTNSMSQLCLI